MARPTFRKDDGGGQAVRGQGTQQEVVRQAAERLGAYEHIRAHAKRISFEFRDGVLTAKGTLPSFYLKQVLQTVLRDLPGVLRIENRVVVDAGPREKAKGGQASRRAGTPRTAQNEPDPGNSSPARNSQK
jgi:hypothetical protein